MRFGGSPGRTLTTSQGFAMAWARVPERPPLRTLVAMPMSFFSTPGAITSLIGAYSPYRSEPYEACLQSAGSIPFQSAPTPSACAVLMAQSKAFL